VTHVATGKHALHTLSGLSRPYWGNGTFSVQHLLHKTLPQHLKKGNIMSQ